MRQSLRKIRVILIVLFVGELGVYASYRCVNYKIIYNYNCSFYSLLPLSVEGIPMHGPLAPTLSHVQFTHWVSGGLPSK